MREGGEREGERERERERESGRRKRRERRSEEQKLAGEDSCFRSRSLSFCLASLPLPSLALSCLVSRSSGKDDAPWGVSRDMEVRYLL